MNHIEYNPKSFSCWFEVSTTKYFQRPQGYYFYDVDRKWCYGPFDSANKANEAYDEWLGMNKLLYERKLIR